MDILHPFQEPFRTHIKNGSLTLMTVSGTDKKVIFAILFKDLWKEQWISDKLTIKVPGNQTPFR